MDAVVVIADAAQAAAAIDPVRARLLAELREPASATELAGRVGLTRQKVNYHLTKLENQGLLVEADTRRWGGLTERRLVASAAGYVISPAALGRAGAQPERSGSRLSTDYLLALAGRLIREVGSLVNRSRSADPAAERPQVFALDVDLRFRSPAERAEFADELTTTVVRLAAKYHDEAAPVGRWHRLLVGVHPVPADVSVGPATEE